MPLIWNWVGGKNTWVQVTFDCTKRQSLWRAAWKGPNCSYLAMWREFQHSLSCAHFLLGQVLRLMHVIAFPAPAPLWTQGFVCCYLQYVKQLDRTWLCCICICFYELSKLRRWRSSRGPILRQEHVLFRLATRKQQKRQKQQKLQKWRKLHGLDEGYKGRNEGKSLKRREWSSDKEVILLNAFFAWLKQHVHGP